MKRKGSAEGEVGLKVMGQRQAFLVFQLGTSSPRTPLLEALVSPSSDSNAAVGAQAAELGQIAASIISLQGEIPPTALGLAGHHWLCGQSPHLQAVRP